MFCSKCGAQMDDGAVFCSFCGTKVPEFVINPSDSMTNEPVPPAKENVISQPKEEPVLKQPEQTSGISYANTEERHAEDNEEPRTVTRAYWKIYKAIGKDPNSQWAKKAKYCITAIGILDAIMIPVTLFCSFVELRGAWLLQYFDLDIDGKLSFFQLEKLFLFLSDIISGINENSSTMFLFDAIFCAFVMTATIVHFARGVYRWLTNPRYEFADFGAKKFPALCFCAFTTIYIDLTIAATIGLDPDGIYQLLLPGALIWIMLAVRIAQAAIFLLFCKFSSENSDRMSMFSYVRFYLGTETWNEYKKSFRKGLKHQGIDITALKYDDFDENWQIGGKWR